MDFSRFYGLSSSIDTKAINVYNRRIDQIAYIDMFLNFESISNSVCCLKIVFYSAF